GLQGFIDTANLFGWLPKILIAPRFSQLAAVTQAFLTLGNKIRAIAFVDAPAGQTVSQVLAARGPTGTINLNVSSTRIIPCFPFTRAYDAASNSNKFYPTSAFAAGARANKDVTHGYWWSISNTPMIGALGSEIPIDSRTNDPNSEINLLNAAGILTHLNSYGSGIKLWGNRSSAFPNDTSPMSFVNIQRVADMIADATEAFANQMVDAPINTALITAIVEATNNFIRALVGAAALLDGVASYNPTLNSVSDLANGHLTISYDFMPPTPAERITFNATININYLANLAPNK
ncbi:MAG: phage tail sheath subtilisin-like domain-containing protein, partial [Alphaproteobacteria bacterium]|nr:phage tail sheath subtilisin-like domain-containing protein [Alphaproteobacteria bacterium]